MPPDFSPRMDKPNYPRMDGVRDPIPQRIDPLTRIRADIPGPYGGTRTDLPRDPMPAGRADIPWDDRVMPKTPDEIAAYRTHPNEIQAGKNVTHEFITTNTAAPVKKRKLTKHGRMALARIMAFSPLILVVLFFVWMNVHYNPYGDTFQPGAWDRVVGSIDALLMLAVAVGIAIVIGIGINAVVEWIDDNWDG